MVEVRGQEEARSRGDLRWCETAARWVRRGRGGNGALLGEATLLLELLHFDLLRELERGFGGGGGGGGGWGGAVGGVSGEVVTARDERVREAHGEEGKGRGENRLVQSVIRGESPTLGILTVALLDPDVEIDVREQRVVVAVTCEEVRRLRAVERVWALARVGVRLLLLEWLLGALRRRLLLLGKALWRGLLSLLRRTGGGSAGRDGFRRRSGG